MLLLRFEPRLHWVRANAFIRLYYYLKINNKNYL